MRTTPGITVRDATAADRDFIVDLVPRLRAFGPPPLRPAKALDAAERQTLERALTDLPSDAMLFVAELDDVGPAGVAYAETWIDYFTGERHGHLGILIVAEPAEGRGVGRALLQATEAWATAQGYRFLTLNVFADNAHARAVYEQAGYVPDAIRYVKTLRKTVRSRSASRRSSKRSR
jgi:GNAT superfamily N-acetyltransferase